ncbi:MAG: hypothetical protein IJA55_09595 [Clostridia bacterium]|nr:hypothetical protein [Clostridia bacterium]
MKEIIREAVNNHMPDKESIRINAMQEPKAAMPKKAYAVLAVAVMIAICTCIAVPMMINEPEIPPPVQVTPADTTTVNNDTTERITLSTSSAFPWDQIDEPDEGIYIPAIELEPPESGAMIDMIGFVVYGGKVYTQAEYIWCDQNEKENYKEAYLGTAKGNYSDCCIVVPGDEYEPVDLTEDFTSNVTGDVYTVKGYNPAFRICISDMYDGCEFIAFFECVNDITLATGEDLYGSQRLNIKGNYDKVYYACSDENGNIYEDQTEQKELSKKSVSVFSDLVDKLMVSEFTEYELKPGERFYPREHKALHVKMKDGSTVELVLFSDGYIDYSYMHGYVVVKVDDPIFDEFYDMLT